MRVHYQMHYSIMGHTTTDRGVAATGTSSDVVGQGVRKGNTTIPVRGDYLIGLGVQGTTISSLVGGLVAIGHASGSITVVEDNTLMSKNGCDTDWSYYSITMNQLSLLQAPPFKLLVLTRSGRVPVGAAKQDSLELAASTEQALFVPSHDGNMAGFRVMMHFGMIMCLNQSVDAGQSEEKNVSTQQYIMFPLWSSISSSYKSSDENDTVDDSAGESPVQKLASENEQALKNVLDKMMDQEKEATKQSDVVRKEFEALCNMELFQGKATKASSTNSFNTVSTPVNVASASRTFNDAGPSYVPLGRSFPLNVNDLADDPLMPNLEDTTEVQTTSFFGSAFDDEDLDTYNYPFADQVMGKEPTKIAQALDDKSWVEAIQEELLQFKIQKVWTLVDLPYGKKAIGTKWVYRNKKYERDIVVRNKAGLMDVKSAFLYGTIEEEVYVSQPLGFVDPEFPEKVYKVEKALYGLHQAPKVWYETLSTYLLDNGFYRDFEQIMHKRFQMSSIGELTFFLGLQVKQKEDGIFISQDKYVGEILKKFGFSSVRTTSTPMETNKALTKDEDGEDVDIHLYRSMIGLLMYLTSFRPDNMFSVCASLRFQVQPKVSYLNAVKRIFRYLKGPNLGLWYPKDSPFILEAFSDSGYEGASLDRKSTTGGCQFLSSRLISWQCKKQTVVANSTTEAEYIAASHCCGQVLWIQNQMLDYGYNFMQTKIHVDNESAICVIKNPVYHSKTKHIEIRHHFIRDSYEKRLIEMVKIHTDNNVADLLTKAFDVSRFNFLVFLTFIHGLCIDMDPHEFSLVYLVISRGGDNVERAITTTASLDAAQDSDNIIRTQTTAMLNVDILQRIDTGGSPKRQDTMRGAPAKIEKKYPLIKELLKKMLNLQLEAEKESTMAFELIKFIKSMLEE
ncbi:putative ribonuclease H-like domain-containing protein [Tanacetum coccineum]